MWGSIQRHDVHNNMNRNLSIGSNWLVRRQGWMDGWMDGWTNTRR